MTACDDRRLLLHGLADGELDAANSIAIEAHLKSCEGCADELRRIEALRGLLADPGLRHKGPAGLHQRVVESLAGVPVTRPDEIPVPRRRAASWLAGGALGAMAASLALLLALPQLTTVPMQDQLVSSHVRSLLASHLTDVQTS